MAGIPNLKIFAAGERMPKYICRDGERQSVLANVVAVSNGLYCGPGLWVPREEKKTTMLYYWCAPSANVLTAWRAMNILNYVPEVDEHDLARCHYAAQGRAVPNEPVNRIARLVGPGELQEIRGQTPLPQELERMLHALTRERLPFSSRELAQDARRNGWEMTPQMEKMITPQAIHHERMEARMEGRRVDVAGGLEQIKLMANEWSRPFVEVFGHFVNLAAAGDSIAYRRADAAGVEYIVVGKSREREGLRLMLHALAETDGLDMALPQIHFQLHSGPADPVVLPVRHMDELWAWGETEAEIDGNGAGCHENPQGVRAGLEGVVSRMLLQLQASFEKFKKWDAVLERTGGLDLGSSDFN